MRVRVTAIVLSISTKFVNKEEIVSDTRSEDSVTLRLSSLRVFTGKMYSLFYAFVFVLLVEKNKLQACDSLFTQKCTHYQYHAFIYIGHHVIHRI